MLIRSLPRGDTSRDIALRIAEAHDRADLHTMRAVEAGWRIVAMPGGSRYVEIAEIPKMDWLSAVGSDLPATAIYRSRRIEFKRYACQVSARIRPKDLLDVLPLHPMPRPDPPTPDIGELRRLWRRYHRSHSKRVPISAMRSFWRWSRRLDVQFIAYSVAVALDSVTRTAYVQGDGPVGAAFEVEGVEFAVIGAQAEQCSPAVAAAIERWREGVPARLKLVDALFGDDTDDAAILALRRAHACARSRGGTPRVDVASRREDREKLLAARARLLGLCASEVPRFAWKVDVGAYEPRVQAALPLHSDEDYVEVWPERRGAHAYTARYVRFAGVYAEGDIDLWVSASCPRDAVEFLLHELYREALAVVARLTGLLTASTSCPTPTPE